jgi:hypothetical protein
VAVSLRLIGVLGAVAGLGSCGAAEPVAGGPCDLYAAPGGSNAAAGTLERPLRTPQALADRLRPGQTGCLRRGTYRSAARTGYVVRFNDGGRRRAPLTLRSRPGERARLAGVVFVPRRSDFVTVADLDIDDPTSFTRAGQLTVQVNASDTVLEGLDITNRGRKTCVVLGSPGRWGTAVRTTLRDSVLHDCGSRANGMLDHAVYVSHAVSARILGNRIVRAAGYAVHLYPDARRTLVARNVMAGNGGGVIFAGEGGQASSGNVVERNVIAGSRRDYNLAHYWGGRVGKGNAARDNCLFSAGERNVESPVGFMAARNLVADPGFARGAYKPAADSPCASLLRP